MEVWIYKVSNRTWDFSVDRVVREVTLYAKWIPNNYAVRFDANGGSGTMTVIEMIYDQSAALPTVNFTKNGYTFLGWSTTSTGAVAYKNKAIVNNLVATNGTIINLYAKWGAPITSAKSYNYNSIKVSWTTADNATSYRIYRSSSATGPYSLVKITDSNARSYVNTGLVTGKTYYYKVSVVAGGMARSWVNTGLTAGKTYYYKVRAYHLEGTTKVYGSFSAVKYLKI